MPPSLLGPGKEHFIALDRLEEKYPIHSSDSKLAAGDICSAFYEGPLEEVMVRTPLGLPSQGGFVSVSTDEAVRPMKAWI